MSLYSKLVPHRIRNMVRPLKKPIETLLCFLLRFKSKNRILSGPFQGMAFRYNQQEYAMLLGTWELELIQLLEDVMSADYRMIVDVGAAEGYYAVGMSYRMPEKKVVAFEMEERVRKNLETLQYLNGTTVEIRGKCEPEDLLQFGEQIEGGFILMDVEGYECVLLDPCKIPSLQRATILVELHDMYVEGCSRIIEKRFQPTHIIQQVNGAQRTINDFPASAGILKYLFSKQRLINLMDEGRPYAMNWFFMVPR